MKKALGHFWAFPYSLGRNMHYKHYMHLLFPANPMTHQSRQRIGNNGSIQWILWPHRITIRFKLSVLWNAHIFGDSNSLSYRGTSLRHEVSKRKRSLHRFQRKPTVGTLNTDLNVVPYLALFETLYILLSKAVKERDSWDGSGLTLLRMSNLIAILGS